MGLFGKKHDDEAELTDRQFKMQQKLMSIGDDYWIENGRGDRAYLVDGKAMRIRDTWELKDSNGEVVATIREKKLSIRDAITIEFAGGRKAVVKKALVGIRDRFNIDVEGGVDLSAKGNIVDHEYEIENDMGPVATVSKRWFRVRDTYGVEVAPDANVVLALAITVAIDALTARDD